MLYKIFDETICKMSNDTLLIIYNILTARNPLLTSTE